MTVTMTELGQEDTEDKATLAGIQGRAHWLDDSHGHHILHRPGKNTQ